MKNTLMTIGFIGICLLTFTGLVPVLLICGVIIGLVLVYLLAFGEVSITTNEDNK